VSTRRIGTTIVYPDASGLIVYCPALRAAAPALMLALFGVACGIIAFASYAGLIGAGNNNTSAMLALAFAGVFVLPLLGLGALFVAIALWTAFNSLTVAVTSGGLRVERRWCGIPLKRQFVAVETISAIESMREARFIGIFSASRYFRLLARGAAGALVLADHLQSAQQTEQLKQLLIAALERPVLAAAGRNDHLADAGETTA
jgi:hypothetical protein